MIKTEKIPIKKKTKTAQKFLEPLKSEILTSSSTFAPCIAREGDGNAYPLRITNECSWAGECDERIKRYPFRVRFRALGLGKVDQGVNKKNIKKEK